LIHVVWEFRVREGMEPEFERRYSSTGAWARLFSRGEGYEGTELMKDAAAPRRYVVIDTWRDAACLARFKQDCAAEYARLDAECESLTEAEVLIGAFEALP